METIMQYCLKAEVSKREEKIYDIMMNLKSKFTRKIIFYELVKELKVLNHIKICIDNLYSKKLFKKELIENISRLNNPFGNYAKELMGNYCDKKSSEFLHQIKSQIRDDRNSSINIFGKKMVNQINQI